MIDDKKIEAVLISILRQSMLDTSVVAAEKDTQWLKTFSESIKKVTE